MPTKWTRRRLLGSLGVVGVAGCLANGPNGGDGPAGSPGGEGTPTLTPEDPGLPDACPTSQDLGIEWPDELDASAVESFLVAYEEAYYRDVVVGYEPRSRVDSYELSARVAEGPSERGGGFEAMLSGGGAVYTPTLLLDASVADPPDDADVVPLDAVDDEHLTETLVDAAEDGEAQYHVERPGPTVDRYIERLDELSADFDPLSGPGDSDTLYVDVDGTTIELTARADTFHGDYWWEARYFVDEQVVRRTDDVDADPRQGKLLECREDG